MCGENLFFWNLDACGWDIRIRRFFSTLAFKGSRDKKNLISLLFWILRNCVMSMVAT